MKPLRTAFTSASYHETIQQLAGQMATANPHVQTVKVIAWLFGVPFGDVQQDIKDVWAYVMRREQNEREERQSRQSRRR